MFSEDTMEDARAAGNAAHEYEQAPDPPQQYRIKSDTGKYLSQIGQAWVLDVRYAGRFPEEDALAIVDSYTADDFELTMEEA